MIDVRWGIGFRTPQGITNSIDHVTQLAEAASEVGLDYVSMPDEFGLDPLLMAGIVGQRVAGIGLMTGVASVYPRHPLMVAGQALAVQAACQDRLVLGLGASHAFAVERVYGLSAERPASYMAEYLAIVRPLLRGEPVNVTGEHLHAAFPEPLPVSGASPPPLILAALGPRMVDLAGRAADGVLTGFAGPRTIAGIALAVRKAAAAAGRQSPRIFAGLPVMLGTEPGKAREIARQEWIMATAMPAYAKVFAREGVSDAGGVALVGDHAEVLSQVRDLVGAGVSHLTAMLYGSLDQQLRTIEALGSMRNADRR